MYLTDRAQPTSQAPHGLRGGRVATAVVLMGTVSLLTDISSESVSAVLAVYATVALGLGPLAYGFLDGIYQGVTAIVRILGGWAADRSDRPKWIAVAGYGLSAISRLALLPAQGFAAVSAVLTADRLGKGIRTAPRDALIAASSAPADLGRAFGVHRAMDTCGAVLGPFVAFAILLAAPGEFHAVFVVSFAAAAVGLAVLLLLVPDVRPRRTSMEQRPVPSRAVLASRPFRRVLLVVSGLGVLTVGDGFLYLALQHRDDFALKFFPLLYVGTNAVYMLLAIPFGRLADRIGRGRLLVLGHGALLAAYVCAAVPAGALVLTAGCLILLGAYYAATDGQLAALTSGLFDGALRGRAIATAQTAVAAARFVSSIAFGALWTLTSQTAAIVVFGVLLLGAVPAAWFAIRHTVVGAPA